ncbi:MAG: T9SS type A sorting domain-containing protein [Bacteroidales bacterium]|nr:T9SS type A sorting domain-containing protein [Bacteroidales bacterium]
MDEVSIYNRLGQKVIHQRGTSNKVDVSSLVPDMYVVEVVIENMKIREKLVIN